VSPPSIPFANFPRELAEIEGELMSALEETLKRGWYILGPKVEALEREFSGFCGTDHGVGVASGTDALTLALLAAGIGSGMRVITAVNTAFPTVSAISATGATPTFVDVSENTFNLDPEALRANLEAGLQVHAIVPVHLFGRPAHMDAILQIADQRDLVVVEDCAQATGATWDNEQVGSLGRAGCFSFYPTKNLGAYGDGGMIVTNDSELDEKLRRLRNYGEAAKFVNVTEGKNSRLDEVQAALLSVKLKYLKVWNARRRQLASMYTQHLSDLSEVSTPQDVPGHVYHLYVIRTERRDALASHLAAAGIQTAIHYPQPVHLQPVLAHLGHSTGDFPVAERLAGEILSLPLYPSLGDEEVAKVTRAIRDFFGDKA
jgi:dTDP-4-amino-4,6-dideoxygalactose transaminase